MVYIITLQAKALLIKCPKLDPSKIVIELMQNAKLLSWEGSAIELGEEYKLEMEGVGTSVMFETTPNSQTSPIIGCKIIPYLSLSALGAFGPKEWETYFGVHIRNVPPLPHNMTEILNSPCLFWPGKKVHETHLLVLIPEAVNDRPLDLKYLGELVQKPLQGHATKYRWFLTLASILIEPAPKTHWVLMTRKVIEGSRNKKYEEEQALLDSYSQKAKIPYEIPTVLDASTCLFMEYVRSGTWLYGDNPMTYTLCQEKYNADYHLVVGGGSAAGLCVYTSHHDSDSGTKGIGLLRTFGGYSWLYL